MLFQARGDMCVVVTMKNSTWNSQHYLMCTYTHLTIIDIEYGFALCIVTQYTHTHRDPNTYTHITPKNTEYWDWFFFLLLLRFIFIFAQIVYKMFRQYQFATLYRRRTKTTTLSTATAMARSKVMRNEKRNLHLAHVSKGWTGLPIQIR